MAIWVILLNFIFGDSTTEDKTSFFFFFFNVCCVVDGRTQTGNDPLWMNKMHFEHKLLLRHGFTQGQHLYYMHHHFAFLFIILQCPSGTEGGIPKRESEKVHIFSPQFKVLSGRVSKYFPSFTWDICHKRSNNDIWLGTTNKKSERPVKIEFPASILINFFRCVCIYSFYKWGKWQKQKKTKKEKKKKGNGSKEFDWSRTTQKQDEKRVEFSTNKSEIKLAISAVCMTRPPFIIIDSKVSVPISCFILRSLIISFSFKEEWFFLTSFK